MRKLSVAMQRMLNDADIQAEARATGDVDQAEEKDGADLVNPTFSAEPVMRGEVEALVEDAVTLRFLPADVDRAAPLPPLKRVFARGKLAAAELESVRRGGEGAGAGAAGQDAGAGAGGGYAYGAIESKRAQFSAISRELKQIVFEFRLGFAILRIRHYGECSRGTRLFEDQLGRTGSWQIADRFATPS
eukprot:scaffold120341_cov57-Phaeocystis_antarctica.AAC.2